VFFGGRALYRSIRALIFARIAKVPHSDHLLAGQNLEGSPLTPAELHDAVWEALQRLDMALNPHDGVILAWLAFEEAAARHGMERNPAQTPTEFTANLLERSPIPSADTDGLRGLYLRARFSHLPTLDKDSRQARLHLVRIARTLEEADT
jgi:hypothetical protein